MKISKKILSLALTIALVASINWTYVGELWSMISSAAMQMVSGHSVSTGALQHELETITLSKFLKIDIENLDDVVVDVLDDFLDEEVDVAQEDTTEEVVDESGISVNPNKIRFSQSSVNGVVESMRDNGWVGAPIDIVSMPDGGLTTIDNTRVVAARQAGIDVQAVIHAYDDLLPVEYIDRFTTKKGVPITWGEAITLRIGKQNATFREKNPYGAINIDIIN